MSEYDYKQGQQHANQGWQPSAPNPNNTSEQNNAYINGYNHQQQQNQQNQNQQNGGK